MKFDEIISSLNTDDKNLFYREISFFIHEVFKNYLQVKNIGFHEIDGRFMPFDFISLDKIKDIEAPIYIEIKFSNNPLFVQKTIENFHNLELKTDIKPKSLLIITNLSSVQIKMIKSKFNIAENIHIYGKDFIDQILELNPVYSKKLLDNLNAYILKSIFSREGSEWKKDREIIIKNLKENFTHGNFALLLGAGVSCDANLPSWEKLISSLLIKSFSEIISDNNEFKDESIKRLSDTFKKNQFSSALLSARYLKKLFTSQNESSEKFVNILHEILYHSTHINRNSKLLESIAKLCVPTRIRAHVDSIITYNFDDLIEQKLESKNLKYHVISNSLEIPSLQELPIYHVHGFIPENEDKYSNDITNDLVFSEDGYYKMYSEPYHWSNLVQLTHLREKVCLMIGLSMDDPNLRRLLDIVSNSSTQPKHYTILQRVKLKELLPNAPTQEENELAQIILHSHHQLQEKLFKDLGVNVIWYEEYSDIPAILEMLLQ